MDGRGSRLRQARAPESPQRGVPVGVLRHEPGASIDVSIRSGSGRRRPGLEIHRRPTLPDEDVTTHRGIPVTSIVRTLLDLAATLPSRDLERAVNAADRLDLIDPEALRLAVDERGGQGGVRRLRELLDRATFRLTDSELERRFLRIVRAAGLPPPETQVQLNGRRVDFFWPELGLVVETDGLRYHRTAERQSNDARRDQAHVTAGLTVLRFSHAQVRYERYRVAATLKSVAARLA